MDEKIIKALVEEVIINRKLIKKIENILQYNKKFTNADINLDKEEMIPKEEEIENFFKTLNID